MRRMPTSPMRWGDEYVGLLRSSVRFYDWRRIANVVWRIIVNLHAQYARCRYHLSRWSAILLARIEPEQLDEHVDFQRHFIWEAGREPEFDEGLAWDIRHDLRRRGGYKDYLERAEDDRRTLIENAERGLHGPSLMPFWTTAYSFKEAFIEAFARPCRFLFNVSLFLADVSLFLARR